MDKASAYYGDPLEATLIEVGPHNPSYNRNHDGNFASHTTAFTSTVAVFVCTQLFFTLNLFLPIPMIPPNRKRVRERDNCCYCC